MMAKNSSIKMSIGAEDRFSKTMDKLENRIARLNAPVKRFQTNAARLDNFGPRQLRKGFLGLISSTGGAAKSLASIIPILGTLTGAASLAGVYRLSSAWAGMGRQLGISSQLMSVAPGRLQAMGNAAKLAGGSAEGMQSTLQQLTNTSFNARTGLDPAALAQFQMFHISAKELEHDAPDQLFERVASQLRKLKTPLERARAAQALFGSGASGVIPVLLQSGQAWQKNINLARRYGVINEDGVEASNRLASSQDRLELAVQGFGNTLAQTVEPILSPIITQMADWIAANRQWISTKITGYVKDLIDWFKDGGWDRITKWAGDFVTKTDDIAQSLGGWKSTATIAAGAIAGLFSAPVIASLIAGSGVLVGILAALEGIAAVKVFSYKPNKSDPKYIEQEKKLNEEDAIKRHYLNRTSLWRFWQFDEAKERAIIQQEDASKAAHPSSGDAGKAYQSPSINDAKALTNRPYDTQESYDSHIYASLHRKVDGTNKNALAIQRSLQRHGFANTAIAGIFANFSQESNLDPSAHNRSHAGIAQWDKGRQAEFQRRYGHPMTSGSVDEQVDFFARDLAKYPKIQKDIMGAKTPEEAGFAMGRHYEIPGITDATLRPDVNARAHVADEWAQALKSVSSSFPQSDAPAMSATSPKPSAPAMSIEPPQPKGPPLSVARPPDHQEDLTKDEGRTSQARSGNTGAEPSSKVVIDINHLNPPPGTRIKLSDNNNPNISLGSLRTHRSMSPDAPSL
ncbi:phage tail tape measure protein [Saccharibacter sp. EH611]|uniref:phage tail tape measure protein n=1 Tax=unclassified Saccharibacter TaxID=2648722 RepID=UPI00132375FD|nr:MULTISPECIES: phage tail tape measure protein [unclassified Saccharibacter]MXV35649.1 phage tail tape measure protein [Saccharibacter sp. EH611]MXV65739.1 phage tail tape measure protein [Saccharibacter sp. EH60]